MRDHSIIEFPFRTAATGRAFVRDRAGAVATAILLTIRSALLAWLHGDSAALSAARGEIEEILRGEFSDIARTTLNEIRREDE